MVNLEHYWVEFLTIASVHFLAVASPGPDFAIVLKHSVEYGRRAAIISSIGIGLGILIHVVYSLLGIGLLIKTTPVLFQAFSYLAAAYLFYIGWGALKSATKNDVEQAITRDSSPKLSDWKAFSIGFLTNGLNPKATLFFLSVFAVVVSAETPNMVKGLYGIYLSIATALWFCLLSVLLSTQSVRTWLKAKGFWFDRLMGIILILLAIKLVIPV